jgi:hypothetical protein
VRQQPVLLLPKFGAKSSHIFKHSPQINLSMRNWPFGLTGRIICNQSSRCERKWWACFAFLRASLFQSVLNRACHSNTRVLLNLSSLNGRLIIASVSVALFPRFIYDLMHTRSRLHRKIVSPNKKTENYYFLPVE